MRARLQVLALRLCAAERRRVEVCLGIARADPELTDQDRLAEVGLQLVDQPVELGIPVRGRRLDVWICSRSIPGSAASPSATGLGCELVVTRWPYWSSAAGTPTSRRARRRSPGGDPHPRSVRAVRADELDLVEQLPCEHVAERSPARDDVAQPLLEEVARGRAGEELLRAAVGDRAAVRLGVGVARVEAGSPASQGGVSQRTPHRALTQVEN